MGYFNSVQWSESQTEMKVWVILWGCKYHVSLPDRCYRRYSHTGKNSVPCSATACHVCWEKVPEQSDKDCTSPWLLIQICWVLIWEKTHLQISWGMQRCFLCVYCVSPLVSCYLHCHSSVLKFDCCEVLYGLGLQSSDCQKPSRRKINQLFLWHKPPIILHILYLFTD